MLIDIGAAIVGWVLRKLGIVKDGDPSKFGEARFDSKTGKQIFDE